MNFNDAHISVHVMVALVTSIVQGVVQLYNLMHIQEDLIVRVDRQIQAQLLHIFCGGLSAERVSTR